MCVIGYICVFALWWTVDLSPVYAEGIHDPNLEKRDCGIFLAKNVSCREWRYFQSFIILNLKKGMLWKINIAVEVAFYNILYHNYKYIFPETHLRGKLK